MYGRWEGELWFHWRHMWPVPSPSTPSLVAPISSSVFIDPNSFSKDGRKIHVGDCALFKPPHDSPPFVGIIRRLIVGKDENVNLSVNWLYRPADVKLVKGASLEAAPNEVFYSFHQDEISAASLLHPCKVAFLRKGFELPSRISSFVCRRVYDIENKCLWWLTDQDYINSYLTQERQEEVNQLLDKSRVEMYGAVQTGAHSPKPLNAPNGTTQLKPSTENLQNSSSIPSQGKSKKREHGVHSSDSVKRERLSKADDADSAQLRPEHTLKTEISKITDKGGLVDFEGVEKLIKLMQPESSEKKIDLACRVMLVDVISVTDRFDCLGRFVQLRGLLILDEWLQEVHKGRIGDGSPKETDKSVEEFLFALLRALDRLPVNLHALQTCNVGKSVNHLRSHKNPEIQKKARSLVDTWKKRVEAEMNIIETRSGARRGGSWPNKSMMSEVSPMGTRRMSGSSEVGAKVSTSQPFASKAKSPESPSTTKLPAPATDTPLVTIEEEKSGSSSPSANNSQSCSSDHGKTGASCREDTPNSNKNSGAISHSKKSNNVLHGSAMVGIQKEGSVVKVNTVNRNFASGKGSPNRTTPERVAELSVADNVNNQRLIVRLPNTVRSPARTTSGASYEDASLAHLEMQEHHDKRERVKEDAHVGTVLCQAKEEFVGSDDVKKEIVTVNPCDEHDGETVEKRIEASKDIDSLKSYEASYSSINALVESCAKISEANVSAPVGDDVGMNLLASVAAGEMSRSDGSPENKQPLPEDTCSGNDSKLRHSTEDGCQSEDSPKAANGHVTLEQVTSVGCEGNAQLDSCVAGLPQTGNAAGVLSSTTNATKAMENNMGETRMSHESASGSFSEKQESEKKLVQKQSSSSNLETQKAHKDSELPTTSSSYVCIGSKAEEGEKPNIQPDSSVLPQTSEHSQADIDRKGASVAPVQEDRPCIEEPVSEIVVKLDFDLNDEVFPSDDVIQGEVPGRFSAVHTPSPLPSSVTVAAAAKGPFFPSEKLIKGKTELGWKGSAATSAFRPAEPRKARAFLDFDLNVGVVEDVSQNDRGLDVDLNICEETPDIVRPVIPRISTRSLLSRQFSNPEPSSSRGFDLNGPGAEEPNGEPLPFSRNGMQFLSSVPSMRMNNNINNNNMDMNNFSSWFPQSNTYPMVVPGASSQRMLNPEIFRGPVLSSSPAVAFPSTTQFQFPGFPFDPNFSLPSNTFSAVSTTYVGSSGAPLCFPTIPSQLVGSSGVVSAPYRPYMMAPTPGGSSNVKWGSSHGLDLNSGPGGADLDPGLRQLPFAGSDEQLKMFQQMAASGSGSSGVGLLKRKERDDGLDGDRISYKHPAWQ